MGKNKHSGGGAGMSRMTNTIKDTFKRKKTKRKMPKNTQQGDSDEEPDEEIPRRKQRKYVIGHQRGDSDEEPDEEIPPRKKGGSAVKRNKRSGRNTRRKSRLLRVYGKKQSKTKTK